MNIPVEFTREHIERCSGEDAHRPLEPFLRSGEPYTSLLKSNPWLQPPDYRQPLVWGEGRYYETTVARKHEHWKHERLPRPTRDLQQLRRDFHRWGFCMIADGLSREQTATLRARVAEQAAAERMAGLTLPTPFLQLVWSLINKGECFLECLEMDPRGFQAGPMVEQLLDETLGAGWCAYSFLSNIAFAGCHPQVLHQDQAAVHPLQTPQGPMLVNVVHLLDDVDEHNGGTLIIPGSHHVVSRSGPERPVGELPPAINTEAPAGTVMLLDGRVLHGTGVNHSERERIILTQSAVKPWLRPQENWMLNIRPELLERLSPKLLQRLGFQAGKNRNLTDGFGAYGSGRAGDPNGDILKFRQAMDVGRFVRVGELTPAQVEAGQLPAFTLREVIADARRAHEARRDAGAGGY